MTQEWNNALTSSSTLAGEHFTDVITRVSEGLRTSAAQAIVALEAFFKACIALPDGAPHHPRCDWCQRLDGALYRSQAPWLKLCESHARIARIYDRSRTDVRFVLKSDV